MSLINTLLRSSSLQRSFHKGSNLSYSVWKSVKTSQDQNPQRVLVNFRCSPNINGCHIHTRYLATSTLRSKEPSSKIEETVERLKEKQKAASSTEPVIPSPIPKSEPVEKDAAGLAPAPVTAVEKKKTLWVRFKDEVMHYYSGFRLLFLDVKVSSKIVWKILRGKQLSRRESRQLVRTTSVTH